MTDTVHTAPSTTAIARRAGLTIGFGMGGFVDGILLHQILEWHNMGSSVLPPTSMDAMRQNMIWDGEFHAAVWIISLVGIYLLLHDALHGVVLPSTRAFTGQILLGWGIFNLVEGIVDHQILGIHHVHDLPAPIPMYDWLFLLIGGAGFALLGWAMMRDGRSAARIR